MSGALLGLACGEVEPLEAAPRPPSFEEFRAGAYQEPDSDIFIVRGDEAIEGVEALRAYYDFLMQEQGTRRDELAISSTNGVRNRWTSAQAINLTYCVSSSSFGSRYNTVVSAMNSAAAAWEAAAKVNFVHLSAYDSNCTATQASVMFDVRQTTTTSYLARAFFPNTTRSGRNILISTSAFGTISPLTLAGLMRHELGHTLGFVHENIRVEAPAPCVPGSNYESLTLYDPNSVMHSPCSGGTTSDYILTVYDKQGAAMVYGTPADTTGPTTSITSPTNNSNVSGTVTLSATASDTSGVNRVEFYMGATLLGTDTSGPTYTTSWNTTSLADGSRSLTTRAYDSLGNVSISVPVSVTVDNITPDVFITSPSTGAQVGGTIIISADVAANSGVTHVDFTANNVFIGSDSTAPFSVPWDTTPYSGSTVSLAAKAYDDAGNQSGFAAVVTVMSP